MIVIEKPRNSGKTTILLHYMVVNSKSLYVAGTEEYAKRAFQKSQELGLGLDKERFVGMCSPKVGEWHGPEYKILVDDADFITERYPPTGFNLVARADVITIVKGAR